jgi:hypothetical protein
LQRNTDDYVAGQVGDYKNFIESDFDEAFDAWMRQTCSALKRPMPEFKFELSQEPVVCVPVSDVENKQ